MTVVGLIKKETLPQKLSLKVPVMQNEACFLPMQLEEAFLLHRILNSMASRTGMAESSCCSSDPVSHGETKLYSGNYTHFHSDTMFVNLLVNLLR